MVVEARKLLVPLVIGLLVAGCGPSPAPQSTSQAGPVPASAAGPAGGGEPFRLLTHCGLKYAKFDGRTWVTDRPAEEPKRAPGADGIVSYDGYTTGRMVRVDDTTLKFTVDPGTTTTGPAEVIFHLTTEDIPLCD